MSSLTVQVVTPLGILIDRQASFVVVPTLSGEVTIYANHIPLISVVLAGELVVVAENERTAYAIWSGVLEVKDDNGQTTVVLLVDRSEDASTIDVARAEEAYKRAEELKQMTSVGDADFAKFESLMNKELNRIKIAKKYK
jgi:F-type H+-transporting ATPase subunit epsilon